MSADKKLDYAQKALRLIRQGFSPIPIVPPILLGNAKGTKRKEIETARNKGRGAGKRPTISKWQVHCHKCLNKDQVAKLFPEDSTQIGVACGYKGLTGFDFDTDNKELLKAALNYFKQSASGTIVRKKGKRGFTIFICCPKLNRSHKVLFTNGHLDILHIGRQSVIPPSIHPDTERPYEWADKSTLYNTPQTELAKINLGEMELLIALGENLAPWITDRTKERAEAAPELKRKVRKDELSRYEAYARTGLKSECKKLADTDEGFRGRQSFNSACALGKYIWHGILEEQQVIDDLADACVTNGLITTDGDKTVRSRIERGFSYAEDDSLPDLGNSSNDSAPPDDHKKSTDSQGTIALRPPKPYRLIGLKNTPQKEFLYGTHYARKYLSVTIAKPNTGKTSLLLVEAVSMASGVPLLGITPTDQLGVWYYGLEDPFEDLQRRTEAAAEHYKSVRRQVDIENRLFLTSGRDEGHELLIAHQKNGDIEIAVPVVELLKKYIIENEIDVLIIDPFVKCHAIDENTNILIDKVAKLWAQIANDCNCSIELSHHPRKTGNQPVTIEDARGASALIGAARGKRVLNRMTMADWEQTQKTDRPVTEDDKQHFIRIDSETNLSPATKASWIHIETQRSSNGHSEGVATQWDFPMMEDLVAASDEINDALKLISKGGPWRKSAQSTNEQWIGVPIAKALKLDPKNKMHRKQLTDLIDEWLKDGILKEITVKGANGKMRPYIEAGHYSASNNEGSF